MATQEAHRNGTLARTGIRAHHSTRSQIKVPQPISIASMPVCLQGHPSKGPTAIPKVTPPPHETAQPRSPQVAHPTRDLERTLSLPCVQPQGCPLRTLASTHRRTAGGRAGRGRWEGQLGPRVRKASSSPASGCVAGGTGKQEVEGAEVRLTSAGSEASAGRPGGRKETAFSWWLLRCRLGGPGLRSIQPLPSPASTRARLPPPPTPKVPARPRGPRWWVGQPDRTWGARGWGDHTK